MNPKYDFLEEAYNKIINDEPAYCSSRVTRFISNKEQEQCQLYITDSCLAIERYETAIVTVELMEIIAVTISILS